jgi:hypothetical protein
MQVNMAQLRTGFKILLFFSAYTPLFVLLLLKLGSQISQWFQKLPTDNSIQPVFFLFPSKMEFIIFLILIAIIIIPNIVLWAIISETRNTNNALPVKISQIKEMNYIYIGYLMSYVIPFLSFTFTDLFDIAAIILLLILVCFIYINSNLLYVNVMLSIFRYNLFKITDSEENEYRIITKNKNHVRTDDLLIAPVSDSSEKFYLEIEDVAND